MVFLYYKSTGGTGILPNRILCFIAWPALLAASSLDYQKTFGGNGAVSIAAADLSRHLDQCGGDAAQAPADPTPVTEAAP